LNGDGKILLSGLFELVESRLAFIAFKTNSYIYLFVFKDRLMLNVTEPNATEVLKESSLEAIGYICQDIVSIPFFFLPPKNESLK
jgi:hypothetical protein